MTKQLAALTVFISAVACSGGGGDGTPAPVVILTQTLDQGNVGYSYFQQLQAVAGTAPYVWSLDGAGDPLPSGISLTPSGALTGTPTQAALRSVVLVVRDATNTVDLVSLALEVRDVEIQGAPPGALLAGQQVSFTASGGVATYSFALMANQSGAALTPTGQYTAGAASGVDVVRATDSDGFFEETSVTVGNDPFVGFDAVWNTTDVWWISWDVVYDPNPVYSADIDEVLVTLGLRAPGSTDANGTEADQLARLLFIRRTLGHLSTMYGNGDDGNPQPGGLSISFVKPSGPSAGTTPPVGGVLGAAPFRYSAICVRHGPNPGVVGTAWLDPSNNSIEHNCGDPSQTSLGVFANRIVSSYLARYNNSIASNPVNAGDVDGLREMLFGDAPSNAREQAIFNVADGFGKTLGAVLAHEVGHSLGLNHSNPSAGQGDIMNASLSVGPTIVYQFNAGHWTELMTNLPGPNR